MTTAVLYHNPRCSKSREAKTLLDDAGVDYRVRLYLNEPLSVAELQTLITQLGITAAEVLRRKEAEYKIAGLNSSSGEQDILDALARFPKLLERPILVTDKGARIGRPPESIQEIL
ncbi:arsenate reductase (glutaredoxin) [Saccharospirillum impatiens]|uniref:arsenate reductase (glutaredoxin) n=1 Tax=Saccharospirillum impatiens TaxID=169438 RepID=UPI0004079C99|nr:arsenate reductase (glutaredoxin) [Saccharospirillum impatiens]